MRAKVAKWGNSYAIRLPKQLVDELRLEGELQIEKRGSSLIVRKPDKKARLDSLLKDMPPQGEVEWGPARGKEVW